MRTVILWILSCAMAILATSSHSESVGGAQSQTTHKHIAGVKYEDAKKPDNQKKGGFVTNKSRVDPYKNYKFR